MSTDAAIPRSSAPGATFARRAIFRLLSEMPAGRLRLTTPSGEIAVFGKNSDATVSSAEPDAEIRIRDETFFSRCLWQGDIGFGEAYMEGLWDTPDLVGVIRWFLANAEHSPALSGSGGRFSPFNLLAVANRLRHALRRNTRRMSRRNISEHYDLPPEFFACFLEPGMTYSSGLWADGAGNLEEAQHAKYERLCRKLRLRPGHKVLEIGCGWGGFMEHAVRNHGCELTGATLSGEQARYAEARLRSRGRDDRARVVWSDYRQLSGQFDRIVSIEMIEAVGYRYLPVFFRRCARLLKPDGLLGMQFITYPDSRYHRLRRGVDFIQKHIFPGSLLLSVNRVNALMQESGFQLHEMRDMGSDYARTLAEWRSRFEDNLASVRELGFDEAFIRKWRYYLCYCQAAFEARHISVVQTVHTAPGNSELDRSAERVEILETSAETVAVGGGFSRDQ